MSGKIIYPTPWKPTLIKGVPRDFAMFSLILSALLAVLLGQILYIIPIYIVCWAYGYLKAKEDPEFFTIYAVRWLKLKATKGDFKGREYIP